MKEIIKKWPFGILTGACAIVFFYSLLAFVAVYLVLSGVAAQTSEVVSPFDSWWQILLFVVCILSFAGMVASFVLFILKRRNKGKEERENEATSA